MHRNSLSQDLIALMLAAGPLRAISDDTTLWRAWIELVSANWNMFCQHGLRLPPSFIVAGAFLCVSAAAQAQAALAALRKGVHR